MPESSIPIYRKRFVPQEFLLLGSDRVLFHNDTLLLTAWETIRPRTDFSGGISAYFMAQGFKISKILSKENTLVHWYCDIITTDRHPADGGLVFTDLLLDVVVSPDGAVRLLDLGEAGDLLAAGGISPALLADGMQKADRLLSLIYAGKFSAFTELIEQAQAGVLPDPTRSFAQFPD